MTNDVRVFNLDSVEGESNEPPFDHSVPYPEAPEPDYNDESQEHYRGVKDPEIVAAHRAKKQGQ